MGQSARHFSNMASANDVDFISGEDLEVFFNVLDIDDLEEDVELQDCFWTMSGRYAKMDSFNLYFLLTLF